MINPERFMRVQLIEHHLTDDQLLHLLAGDYTAARARRLLGHLKRCGGCAVRWERLKARAQ